MEGTLRKKESVDLDWLTMSWYDTAVKKLGFPTIELFVKVSDARKLNMQNVVWHCAVEISEAFLENTCTYFSE